MMRMLKKEKATFYLNIIIILLSLILINLNILCIIQVNSYLPYFTLSFSIVIILIDIVIKCDFNSIIKPD